MNSILDTYRQETIPDAIAFINGCPLAPNIKGIVSFYQYEEGVNVVAYIGGMPIVLPDGSPSGFHGFHIHQNGDCTIGDQKNPFTAAGSHLTLNSDKHPFHAGDLPPLLSNNGKEYGLAMMSVLTNRFKINDIIGKSIIIHQNPDDLATQPSGNSGPRWACGIIKKYNKKFIHNI